MKAKATSETRQKIVDTASRLFYTQGYTLTGINQIIKEAEVAKATLYEHFPSKEDLLAEYLATTAKTTNEAIHQAIAQAKKPKEKILAAFDFLTRFSKSVQCGGCNFLNIASEVPKENARIRNMVKEQKDYIRNLFKEILPVSKKDLADQLYILFDGAMIATRVQGNAWPIATAKKIVEKLI